MSLTRAVAIRLKVFWLGRCARRFAIRGRLWLHGHGSIEIGRGSLLEGGRIGIDLHPGRGAHIVIGENCRVGPGVSIEACEMVRLGNGVTVGQWTKILDNNFHTLGGKPSDRSPSRPVVIEDLVTIGAHAIILPGVHIGRGARIAEGAVVHRRVPAGAHVGGNPARLVRSA